LKRTIQIYEPNYGDMTLLKINEIEPGMNVESVKGKIIEISEPRIVNTRYGKRSVADVKLEDETGTIKLSLWEQNIDLVYVGDLVSITGAYVTVYRDEIQLNISRSGTIEVVNRGSNEQDILEI
jgi:replication factor A1